MMIRSISLLVACLVLLGSHGCGGGGGIVLGTLAIRSNPSGIQIFLDGADTGQQTPATINNVSVGPHTIRLIMTGGAQTRSATIPINVVAGNNNVSFDFTGTGSITVNVPAALKAGETFTVNAMRDGAVIKTATGNVVGGSVSVTLTDMEPGDVLLDMGMMGTSPDAGVGPVIIGFSSAQTAVASGQTRTVAAAMTSAIAQLLLSTGSVTVFVGENRTVTARAVNGAGQTVPINGTFVWVSGNTGIATVNGSGVVSGVAKGNTTATVLETESNVSSAAAVEVIDFPPPPP